MHAVLAQVKHQARDDGSGGDSGIVVPLVQVGTNAYDIGYAVSVSVGSDNPQNVSLQVDTGSSDLWIASISCTSQECQQIKTYLYNPSDSQQTGDNFTIDYLSGSVSGPIVWDQIELGGYTVANQALAAASSVSNEPLASNFNGVLGLALPLNSLIAQQIPPTISNDPDGAAFASNLFSITPLSAAPPPFLALSLSRPGSNDIPALLGIGQHPSEVVSNPGGIKYSTLVSSMGGALFWRVNIQAITVYVNSQPKTIALGQSLTGNAYTLAVLDTGVPMIITTSVIANGIYGALNVGPASDGQYYLPCTTPINMTITIDGFPEIPLHPLDLTAPPLTENSSPNCVGLIQVDDTQLEAAGAAIGDMVLGVPFMRNVYTVMAYEPPDSDGEFGHGSMSGNAMANEDIVPRIGLLGLTNATKALEEFHTVRVLNQPLSSSTPTPSTAPTSKGLAVGIKALIGLGSFMGFCAALFFLWWVAIKRQHSLSRGVRSRNGVKPEMGDYELAKRRQPDLDIPSEDALRILRYQAYQKERVASDFTGSTMVNDDEGHAHDSQESEDSHSDAEELYRPQNYDSATPSAARNDLAIELVPPDSIEVNRHATVADVAHFRNTSEQSNTTTGPTAPLLRRDGRMQFDLLDEAEESFSPAEMVGSAMATRSLIDPPFPPPASIGFVESYMPESHQPPRRFTSSIATVIHDKNRYKDEEANHFS